MKIIKFLIFLLVPIFCCGQKVQSFFEGSLLRQSQQNAIYFGNAYAVKGSIGYAGKIYAGVGIGIDIYQAQKLVPLTIEIRTNFKKEVSPLLCLSGGYSVAIENSQNKGGIVISPAIGIITKLEETQIYFTIGYKSQSWETAQTKLDGSVIYTIINDSYFTMNLGIKL